ncbi:hypothetical protein [Brucella pituitosa]|uniref:Uncharacterized protein n=1 Tax=Brucella pituitosa TaxID=571256 RepID=A0A643EXS5_9HYPH|nr:hypothetical protein [Brucella pituitosa]KAB0570538.1 hypothetical protein F7Q93_14955 [Brucella pituitosa]
MSEQAQGAGARVNTGGNAFPSPDWNGGWKGPDASHGMTLRDHFAGIAMGALYSNGQTQAIISRCAKDDGVAATTYAAKAAYEIADAMIAARGH